MTCIDRQGCLKAQRRPEAPIGIIEQGVACWLRNAIPCTVWWGQCCIELGQGRTFVVSLICNDEHVLNLRYIASLERSDSAATAILTYPGGDIQVGLPG